MAEAVTRVVYAERCPDDALLKTFELLCDEVCRKEISETGRFKDDGGGIHLLVCITPWYEARKACMPSRWWSEMTNMMVLA